MHVAVTVFGEFVGPGSLRAALVAAGEIEPKPVPSTRTVPT